MSPVEKHLRPLMHSETRIRDAGSCLAPRIHSVIRTADGSPTLHSERYGETYHSVNGAVTEARHVFLNASGVAARLENGQATSVLEIGFGLGLNCLLTADKALSCDAALNYHAIEHDLAASQTKILAIPDRDYALLLATTGLEQQLKNAVTDQADPSLISLVVGHAVNVAVRIEDAAAAEYPVGMYDAIYLDAFSPDVNPECWTPAFLSQLYAATTDGGTLTTYSAKGSVRRALIAAGFFVKKMAGPPGKREMLHASR